MAGEAECYIGVGVIRDGGVWGGGVSLSSPSEAPLWGRSHPRSPPAFGAPGEAPGGPLCLCMLLFPLHAQTPSPPRCARRGLGRLRASRATPGSRRPWRSAGGTVNPTGSGLDLQEQRQTAHKCFLRAGH